MAGAWDAKVEISTADATLNLRNLKTEAAGLAAALRALDTELVAGQRNIQAVAKSFTEMVVAQRQAAAGARELSVAQLNQSKADAAALVANARAEESMARRDLANKQSALTEERLTAAIDRRATAEARAAAAAASTARSGNSDLTLSDNLSNSRYLLYDVGATYGALSVALMAIPAATAAVAASYQKDFAQVLRVTGETADQASGLRQNLKDLATQIPLTFADLSNIAQIGAQMGIANDKLGAFTETTAKFTAVTGIATETAATLFGRLQNMFPDESKSASFFNSIGSSIAKVGAATVATDPQIAAMVTQIAAVGSSAGFTASQTVGLSAALSSVAVQPELARGTLTRVFGKLNMDVAEGSTKMGAFGSVLKMTSQQASSLWQSDPSGFFTQLIKGLHDVQVAQGGVGLTKTLADLGVSSVRDVSTLTRLAVGYDTVATSMDTANAAAKDGTALDEMSKPVFSTLASQLKEIGSAIKNLMDTMGGSSLGPMTTFLDVIKSLITGFDQLLKTVPGFQVILGIGAVLALVTGAFLAMKTAQAFALAGLVGFQQVAGKAGLSGAMSLKGVLEQLTKTWLMAGGASADAATEMVASAGMMRSAALAVSGGAASLNTANTAMAAKSVTAGSAIKGLGSTILGMAGGPIGIGITAIGGMIFAMSNATKQAEDMGKAIADGLKGGDASGIQAITAQLSQLKIDPSTDGLYGVTHWGASFADVAKDAGVSMTSIVAAISHGKAGVQEFQNTLDQTARDKGFKNFDDWSNSLQDGGVAAVALQKHVNELIGTTAKAGSEANTYTDTQKALGAATSDSIDPITGQSTALSDNATAADNADKALKSYMDDVFGMMDAAAGTADALDKLGGSLAKSKDLGLNTAGGRDNAKNIEDVLRKAATEQQNLINSGQETAQQAATTYSAFISNLMKKLTSMGVDTSKIQGLADQAAGVFDSEIQKMPAATVKVKVDSQKVQDATNYLDYIVSKYKTTNISLLAKITGTDQVGNNVYRMQQYIESATGQPYVAHVNADTSAANTNVSDTSGYIDAVTRTPYTATLTANTDPAVQAFQGFAQFAASVINSVIDGINGASQAIDSAFGQQTVNSLQHVGWGASDFTGGTGTFAASVAPPSLPAPPAQVAASGGGGGGATPDSLNALDNGYQNVADSAKKAGSAGQKAGQDMAKGIDAATAATNDYASRLNTALTSAYDKQYGLTTATDAYHTALNTIAKKREDDLKSVSDLIQKQKELNDAMGKDLVDANKAKVEQGISLKYGETARAAAYGNQAQTALDNAAAKKKEMDADAAQQKTIQDGIGALSGYSQAAIDNRAALRDLEKKQLDMVVAYANTGASQQQVEQYTKNLTGTLKSQVTQLGFNKSAVDGLIGNVGRYRDAVARVPYRVSTTATNNFPSGAGQAGALAAAIRNIPRHVDTTVAFHGGSLVKDANMTSDHQQIYDVLQDGHRTSVKLFNHGGQVPGFADGGLIPGTPPSDPRADNLMAQVDGKGMVRVRSREFIEPQEAVDYYGLDFMNAIRTLSLPKFNFGGQVGGGGGSGRATANGPMLVELTASNIAAILRGADRELVLYADSTQIARSANNGNEILASTGAN